MRRVIDVNEPQRGPAVVDAVDGDYVTLRYDRPLTPFFIDGGRVRTLDLPDRTFWIERVKRKDLVDA